MLVGIPVKQNSRQLGEFLGCNECFPMTRSQDSSVSGSFSWAKTLRGGHGLMPGYHFFIWTGIKENVFCFFFFKSYLLPGTRKKPHQASVVRIEYVLAGGISEHRGSTASQLLPPQQMQKNPPNSILPFQPAVLISSLSPIHPIV